MVVKKSSTTSGKKISKKVVAKKSVARKVTSVGKVKLSKVKKTSVVKPKTKTISSTLSRKGVKKTLDLKKREGLKKEMQPKVVHNHKQYAAVDKKINSFYAIIFIFVLSVVVGGLVFLSSKKEAQLASKIVQETKIVKEVPKNDNVKATSGDDVQKSCSTHKFDGEAKVHGWYVEGQDAAASGVLVGISLDDLVNLPIANPESFKKQGDFVIKVVDAKKELVASLKSASKEKPFEFTIKGYVLTCDETHLSSIEPASIAFKKI